MNNDFKILLKDIIDNNYGYKEYLTKKENKFYNLKENTCYDYINYVPLDVEEFELEMIKQFCKHKELRFSKIKENIYSNEYIKENMIDEESLNRGFRDIVSGTYFSLNNISCEKIYSHENLFKAHLKYLQKATTTYFAYFKIARALNIEKKKDIDILEKCYHINVSILARMYNYILDTNNIQLEDKIVLLKKLSPDDKNRFLFKFCEKEDIDYLLGNMSKNEYHILKDIKNKNYGDFIYNKSTTDLNRRIDESPENQLKRLTIAQYLDKNPVDEFPQARKMHRHFIIHSGTTNSGKTYQSLEDLKFASKGAYLAPLRLLAIEVQERLVSQNINCDLLTGEEEILSDNATHVSSTVEKANYSTKYDVVVIDECQMISDIERGGAWTNAILGMQSDVIHLCTSPSAVNLLIKLISLCGDTYEHITHERNTKLLVDTKPFRNIEDCEKGDALILFSKKKVLAVASTLLSKGIKTSIIYGSLPYETRKNQIKKFTSGETDVIVATDAIGLGLNIPVKRVVFIDNYKFDGKQKRKLYSEEVKQIAGRAGRFGMYDVGYVNSLNDLDYIKLHLNSHYKDINRAKLTLPESIIDVDGDLAENIKIWSDIAPLSNFEKPNIDRTIFLLSKLKKLGYENIGNYYSYKLSTMYFQENNNKVFDLWVEYINEYFTELKDEISKPNIENFSEDLEGLESYNKSLELYYTFSKTLNLSLDSEWVRKEKLKTSEEINNILLEEIKKHGKKCNKCRTDLGWDSLEALCVKCALKEAMKNTSNNIRINMKSRKK